MKTLDEVIKAHEFCVNSSITGAVCEECPAFAKPDCMIREDALHYLKEYQKLDSLNAIAFPEDANDNLPLTWDELKQKIGQPVWLETNFADYNKYGRWAIIEGFDTTKYNFEYIIFKGDSILNKEYINVDWKAYLKN